MIRVKRTKKAPRKHSPSPIKRNVVVERKAKHERRVVTSEPPPDKETSNTSLGEAQATFSMTHIRQTRDWLLHGFAFAPRTIKSRDCAYRSWCEFVDRQRLSRRPTVDSLADYLVHEIMRGRKISGISTYLGGIGATCKDRGEISDSAWNTLIQSRLIQLLKRSAERRELIIGIKTKKAAAITLEQLERLCKEGSTYNHQVLAAVSVTGFFNLHRGGELVRPGSGEETLKQPYAQDVRVDEKGIRYVITSSKTRVFIDTELFLRAADLPPWAFQCWRTFWIERNKRFSGYPDLFIMENGVIATAKELSIFLSQYEIFSTHSLRSGGATYLMLMGKTLLQVMQKGRWATIKSVLGYLREDPNLGALLKEVSTCAGTLREEVLLEFET